LAKRGPATHAEAICAHRRTLHPLAWPISSWITVLMRRRYIYINVAGGMAAWIAQGLPLFQKQLTR